VSRPLRALGLDLSLASTGLARTHSSDGEPRLSTDTITTSRTPGHRNGIDHPRLHKIFGPISLAAQAGLDVVGVEWLPQYEGHGDASLRLAELHGLVRHWLWSRGVVCVDIMPTHLQMYATGKGRATKRAVREAVQARYGKPCNVLIGSEDAADALTVLAMTLDAYGQPLADVPMHHSKAIAATTWPQLAVS
jgi:crossover junction endodeoxyribonuclease RuvC